MHWRSLLLLLLGIFFPLQIFGDLAEDVWENEGGFPWDVPILLAIHSTANPQLTALAINLTKLGVFWGSFRSQRYPTGLTMATPLANGCLFCHHSGRKHHH